MLGADLGALAAATTVAVALNQVFAQLFSDKPLHGFPRWRWILSVFIQCTALLLCLVMTALTNGPLGAEWLAKPWADFPDHFWMKGYFYVLVAAQARDLSQFENKLLFVHHVVVIATALGCLLVLQYGAGFYVYVSGVLEIGSIFYNLRVLYPTSHISHFLYSVVMPLSNLAALVAVPLLTWSPPQSPAGVRAAYIVALVGVCVGREREHLKYLGLWGSHKKPAQH
eukprot:EG_transcript_16340